MKKCFLAALISFIGVISQAQVQTPPSFTSRSQNACVQVGADALLIGGSAIGNPAPQYFWKQNATVIANATNNTLLIPAAQFTNAGVYTFVASNSVGLVSTNVYLSVVLTPGTNILDPHFTNYVAEGTPYTMNSFIMNVPGAVNTYGWTFNAGPFIATTSNLSLTAAQTIPQHDGVFSIFFSSTVDGTLIVNQEFDSYWVFAPLVPPSIGTLPQNLFVLAGSNVVLNISAAGLPPLIYQWQNSEGVIWGATNSTFEIANVQQTDSDNYSVIVSNPYGSVTSSITTLTVVFPPSISSPPVSQAAIVDSSVALSVNAGGTLPLAYQWQNSSGPILGATNTSLVFNLSQTNESDDYFVVITNAYGTVTSPIANLVIYQPISILVQPTSQLTPYRGSAIFGVSASGFPTPISYQWSLNGTNLLDATSNILTISNISLNNTGNYQVQVNNGYTSTNSSIATLNILPTLTSPFLGETTIWGRSASLTVGAYGSGQLSYQWYVNGVEIGGATSPTLNFDSIQFTNGGLYSVVVSSPFGSVTNPAAQVVVNPAGLSLGFYPGLTFTGVAGYTYTIQSSRNLENTNDWITLTNLTLSQPVQLWVDTNVDASQPFNPKTFYRVLPAP